VERYKYRVFTVPGHIRIVNDPVELVPLLMTFNDPDFKKVYELLNKSWLTEEEIRAQVGDDNVALCLQILKKGNLVEEQWRMPKPGAKPQKEFRATSARSWSRSNGNYQRATARSTTFPGNSMSVPSLSRGLPNG
jgi:predicted DNA-binding ArsR family transcriptional regulator